MVHLLWDNIGIQNVKVNRMKGKVHFDKIGGIRSVTVNVTDRNLTNQCDDISDPTDIARQIIGDPARV